ncbi:MAG: putative Ig domain-containing protein, partial [Deltaproteobacteria bacterium]|nr:putative Ig domain-containing protein [Deltaproteobacteria bacterium]
RQAAHDGNKAISFGGVQLTIETSRPAAKSCLEAIIRGKPSNQNLVWAINDINVQEGPGKRLCLERARRGDVVSVFVGDQKAGASNFVMVANTPPKVLDTKLELFEDGTGSYLQIVPTTEDADDDYVTLNYRWFINGIPNEEIFEDRLPSDAFLEGDIVQVQIVPSDGQAEGPIYLSRDVEIPKAIVRITSKPPSTFQSKNYSYQITTSVSATDSLVFNLDDAPNGMSIDPRTGMISWPLDSVAAGEYKVKVSVLDTVGRGEDTQEFTVKINDTTGSQTKN